MGAKIFVYSNEATGMPWASEYYLRNDYHVVRADKWVKRINVNFLNVFTFKNLVESIDRHCQPGDDVGIVCHGIPHKLGLHPIIGSDAWAEINFARRMAVLDPDLSTEMGLTDTQFETLTDQILSIRKRRLNHIMIQACRIGQDRSFLSYFADIFRAKSISAPTLKTIYGNCEVYQCQTQKDRDSFRAKFPHFFEVPLTNGKSVTLARSRKTKDGIQVVILTDSWETLIRFTQENFPSMPNLGNLTKTPLQNVASLLLGISKPALFPFHGLVSRESKYKYYFPKDPRYAAAVTYVEH